MSEQIKDFLDAKDFEKFVKATLKDPDLTGGENFYGTISDLKHEWMYNDKEIQTLWRCFRYARNGYIPNPTATEPA